MSRGSPDGGDLPALLRSDRVFLAARDVAEIEYRKYADAGVSVGGSVTAATRAALDVAIGAIYEAAPEVGALPAPRVHDCQEWREDSVGCATCNADYAAALDRAEARGRASGASRSGGGSAPDVLLSECASVVLEAIHAYNGALTQRETTAWVHRASELLKKLESRGVPLAGGGATPPPEEQT